MTSEPNDEDRALIEGLLSQPEDRTLEFKAAVDSFRMDKVIDYCCAIANERGGRLLLGITDSVPRTVVGTEALRDPAEVERRVYEELEIAVVVRELRYDGLRVLLIQIPSRRRGTPVSHKGRYLTRVGESLVSMKNQQLQDIFSETQLLPDLEPVTPALRAAQVLDFLDTETYFRLTNTPVPADDDEKMARLAAKSVVVEEDGGWRITRAGALFLARSLDDFSSLALRRVRVIRYAGGARVDATFEHFETRGYALAFDDLLALVNGMLPIREVIEGGRRETFPAYPPTAIREFVANALVHQDLEESTGQLLIELFDDRLEIRNPGLPLIDVKRFVDDSRQRNQRLAELMRLADMAEVRGSGVDRALEEIEDVVQPAPHFVAQAAATSVIMYASLDYGQMTLDDKIWTVFLHCCVRFRKEPHMTNSSVRQRFNLPDRKVTDVSTLIAATTERGLIKPDPKAGRSRRHASYVPFFAPD